MISKHKKTLIKHKEKPLAERAVNMSNTLTRAAHGLLLSEKRIIATALAITDSASSKSLFDANRNQGWKVRIAASDYAEQCGISLDTAYNQLKSASDKLWQRYIRYIVDTRRGPKEVKFRWVSSVTYHHGEGWVELNFTPEIAPHLLCLRKQFTSYKLKHAAAFDSIYAWRLYECLKSWQNTGCYAPQIDDFHHAMESSKTCQKNFKDLRRRVIEPAVSAIVEKAELLVQWKPIKAGRKVIGLEFHFQPNPQRSLL